MTKKAELNLLHAALALALADRIANGEEVERAGKTHTIPVSASLLNVARQFLRDNDITCDGDNPSREVTDLKTAFDEIDADEDGLPTFVN